MIYFHILSFQCVIVLLLVRSKYYGLKASVQLVDNCGVLLQSRSQTLQKQLQEMHEQIEQTVVEMKTFENLREHEVIAVPKRVEVCIATLL